MLKSLFLLTISIVIISVSAVPPPGNNGKLLIVVDSLKTKTTHSQFISSLTDKGFKTTLVVESDPKAKLAQHGEFIYDGLVLLCPQSNNIANISPSQITQFLESGRNVFITADTHYSSFIKKVAQSIGVDMDRDGSKAIDHQNVYEDLDNGDHSYIIAGGISNSKYMFGEKYAGKSNAKIVFSGVGASSFADNELIDAVIWGSSSAYSYKPGQMVRRAPLASGMDVVLGAALSTRVGSRAAYWGSFKVLSNEVFDKVDQSHREILMNFLGWTFGHSGILRWGKVECRRIGHVGSEKEVHASEEEYYRVKDILEFSIDLEVWDGNGDGTWKVYDGDDVQLEFTMMDPYVRTRLKANKMGGNGTHSAKVTVPDKIGVYKFVIDYWRVGVSPIVMKEEVPIRPFMHNEYERFIGQAMPYYISAFSMLAGVFLLGIAVLYSGSVYGKLEKAAVSPSAAVRKKRI